MATTLLTDEILNGPLPGRGALWIPGFHIKETVASSVDGCLEFTGHCRCKPSDAEAATKAMGSNVVARLGLHGAIVGVLVGFGFDRPDYKSENADVRVRLGRFDSSKPIVDGRETTDGWQIAPCVLMQDGEVLHESPLPIG